MNYTPLLRLLDPLPVARPPFFGVAVDLHEADRVHPSQRHFNRHVVEQAFLFQAHHHGFDGVLVVHDVAFSESLSVGKEYQHFFAVFKRVQRFHQQSGLAEIDGGGFQHKVHGRYQQIAGDVKLDALAARQFAAGGGIDFWFQWLRSIGFGINGGLFFPEHWCTSLL